MGDGPTPPAPLPKGKGEHRSGTITEARVALPFRGGGARLLFLAALLVAFMFGHSDSAEAHRAMLIGREGLDRDTAMWIADADIAWAVYGQLPAGATQFLAFARPASGMFRARVLVGTQQANLALKPWLALVGPGLPRPEGLDGLLGPDEGAVFAGSPPDRELELFEQGYPWPVLVGASMELLLPADGTYYLLVFDPSGQAGPYLVDTGYLQD
jgi:hypothetical protein